MDKVDITIIGAGVVGLAIAERLSSQNKDIFVVEKESSFGQGVSSRNSEVIHAGIYYPTDSLKAKTCVEGNRMLYETCQKNNIPFKKLGKLIVATIEDEVRQVEKLYKLASANGVIGLEIIDSKKIKELEPNINAQCALFSPQTGIIDSHSLMAYLQAKAKSSGVGFIYESKVNSLKKKGSIYKVEIQDKTKDKFSFESRVVINSAGLYSDTIAGLLRLNIQKLKYDLKFCKGQYFRLSPEKSKMVNRLIYPVPEQSDGGLGIHITPDISGQVKLGPDAKYLKNKIENYEVDINKKQEFIESVNKFASFIKPDDISADTAGIRPKLEGPKDGFRDFVIKEESVNSFPAFINLIGIESPGLTSALAIAKYVENILKLINN